MHTTTRPTHARVTFEPAARNAHIDRVGILGMGDVVQQRIWPALRARSSRIAGVAVCSLEPTTRLDGLPHVYCPLSPVGRLPLDELEAHGLMTPRTLWVIATPPQFHVRYALELAGRCRVAVEKPLAGDSDEARQLTQLCARGADVHPIDHKLFTASFLTFLEHCRAQPDLLGRVRRVEGAFYEAAGFAPGRQGQDCIADLQWHLLAALVSLFHVGGAPFELGLDRVRVATHGPDPAGYFPRADVWTATRLEGRLHTDATEVRFDFRQAKGAPRNEKHLRLLDEKGGLVHAIDLGESGWQAHGRVLDALMRPHVDMRHSLADAIAVAEVVDAARAAVSSRGTYAFGTLPKLLR